MKLMFNAASPSLAPLVCCLFKGTPYELTHASTALKTKSKQITDNRAIVAALSANEPGLKRSVLLLDRSKSITGWMKHM
jgi:hypothetical protein